MRRWAGWMLACVTLLAGCAGQPTLPGSVPSRAALDAFSLDGRFSLYQDSKGYSGRLSWTHAPAASEVLLSSPFGQGIAEVVVEPGGARLKTSDGKTYAAPDAETLKREVLGYPLPLAKLVDWVRGRVGGCVATLDAHGRIGMLRYADWQVVYAYGDERPDAPPIRIDARRGGEFELRLFIDEWRSLLSEETQP